MRKSTLLCISFVLPLFFGGCGANPEKETAAERATVKASHTESTTEEINGMSIYQLTSTWKTQDNDSVEFKDLRGEVLVVVMIYTSCQSACPRLVADMKGIESKITPTVPDGVRYVLVSIDPARDTPERLKKFSIENELSDRRWLFLQGTEESVRDFANVLAVRYTEISPVDFSHSNIISVFDSEGVMRHQQEGLGVDYQQTVNTVLSLAAGHTEP